MSLATAFAALCRNTYTRTPYVRSGATEDNYYGGSGSDGTPVPGVPCLYHPASTPSYSAIGGLVRETPTLSVLPGDPLKVGDLVSAILAADGSVLEAGPLTVTAIDEHAPFGALAKRTASLEAAEAGVA